jgi:two-component system, sensor histidine kinase RegB
MNQPLPEAAPQLALPWIARLRWGMVFGQIATPLFVHYVLNIDLLLAALAPAPILVGASNWWLSTRVSRPDRSQRLATSTLVAWIFVLDILCLTGLLMLTGGSFTPFNLLFLVQITLSSAILTKRWTWFLGALSTLCFGALFAVYRPIPALEMHAASGGANLHLIGMWVGFAVAAFLIAMFSGKISELLRQGTGMTPEVLRRIGEPFFTTKEPGKGMGLGTFLARTLAGKLGGRLTFESPEEAGFSAILELRP